MFAFGLHLRFELELLKRGPTLPSLGVLHLIDPFGRHQAFFFLCADKFGGRAARQKGGSGVD